MNRARFVAFLSFFIATVKTRAQAALHVNGSDGMMFLQGPYQCQVAPRELSTSVFMTGILQNRLPSVGSLLVPSHCQTTAQAIVDQFAQDDLDNLQHLANQSCSYKRGWLEYVPGTCQAGGPPPLCPVNHWYRDQNKASKQWEDVRRKLFNDRFERMKAAACSCWRADIAAATAPPPLAPTPQSSQSGPPPQTLESLMASASSGPTLDSLISGTGTATMMLGGVVDLYGSQRSVWGDAVMTVWSQVPNIGFIDPASSENTVANLPVAAVTMLGQVLGVFPKILGVLDTAGIFGGIFDPTLSLSTDSERYGTYAGQIVTSLTKLKSLYQEALSYVHGQPSRAPQQINADIASAKTQLQQQLGNLNDAYNAISAEQSLPRGACEDVFALQHQTGVQIINSVLNTPSLPTGSVRS